MTTTLNSYLPTSANVLTATNLVASLLPMVGFYYAPKASALFALDTLATASYSQAGETPLTTLAVSAEYVAKDLTATFFTTAAVALDTGLSVTIGTSTAPCTSFTQNTLSTLSSFNNTVVDGVSYWLPSDTATSAANNTSLVAALFNNDIVRLGTFYALNQNAAIYPREVGLGIDTLEIYYTPLNISKLVGISAAVAAAVHAVNEFVGTQVVPETTQQLGTVWLAELDYAYTTVWPTVASGAGTAATACVDAFNSGYETVHDYFYPHTDATTEHTA